MVGYPGALGPGTGALEGTEGEGMGAETGDKWPQGAPGGRTMVGCMAMPTP